MKTIYNLILVAFLLCLSAFVKTPTVNVTAHLKDGENLITEAQISINNGAEIIKTDELGFLTLTLEKGQKYDLKVSAEGYETVEQKDFKAKEDMEIRFLLKKQL